MTREQANIEAKQLAKECTRREEESQKRRKMVTWFR